MDVPDNLETLLKALLTAEDQTVQLNTELLTFIDRVLRSVGTGSKGIFLVLHPTNRMQYMVFNTSRAGVTALLAHVLQRIAEALETDLD